MSDNGSSISGPRGLQTPAVSPQKVTDRPQTSGGRTAARAARPDQEEQTDLDNAFGRLDTLLARDDGGEPRSDVPTRGFYLNILV
ncbi:hypothetical protein [Aestuariispira insulae]|uniref:Uncharacterized protein n=1 Tax=Aestuariispira insulae TaxID=1461337 RepID=A0A3D9HF63_9PROT|nr:hypothetical protein [Aestuariispira insulae]RED48132.1 hypothetical protein DFP90_108151 [Aestuariispira insulae]